MDAQLKLMLIVIGAGVVGSVVRILNELQKRKIPNKRKAYIAMCTGALLIVIWHLPPLFGITDSKVYLSIIAGIISVDVVELFITKGAGWIEKFINKKFNFKEDESS